VPGTFSCFLKSQQQFLVAIAEPQLLDGLIANVPQVEISNHIVATQQHVPTVVDDHSLLGLETRVPAVLIGQLVGIEYGAEMGWDMIASRPINAGLFELRSNVLLSLAL
jgi:hypothetical protein